MTDHAPYTIGYARPCGNTWGHGRYDSAAEALAGWDECAQTVGGRIAIFWHDDDMEHCSLGRNGLEGRIYDQWEEAWL